MNSVAEFPTFTLDDELKDALERVNQTFKTSVEEAALMKNAFNPMQGVVQVTEQVTKFFSDADWIKVMSPKHDAEVYKSSFSELMDIQKASIERLSKSQKELIGDTFKDVANTAKSVQPNVSPQKNLAAYINANLDGLEKIQKDMASQASLMGSIHTAYMAWLEKTLQAAVK